MTRARGAWIVDSCTAGTDEQQGDRGLTYTRQLQPGRRRQALADERSVSRTRCRDDPAAGRTRFLERIAQPGQGGPLINRERLLWAVQLQSYCVGTVAQQSLTGLRVQLHWWQRRQLAQTRHESVDHQPESPTGAPPGARATAIATPSITPIGADLLAERESMVSSERITRYDVRHDL